MIDHGAFSRLMRSTRCVAVSRAGTLSVSVTGSPRDRQTDAVSPLGPAAVVVAYAVVAKQVRQHEPRVRRSLADPAVGDDIIASAKSYARSRRSRAARSAVLNVPSGLAARAQGTFFAPGMWPPRNDAFLRILRHVSRLAGVFSRAIAHR